MSHERKFKQLRELLRSDRLSKVAGAHDALTAKIAEKIGFDAIWASGFGISATYAVPDASILTMTEFLNAAIAMNHAVHIPVIADCDTGFGGLPNVASMIKKYESAGIAGICIEDKIFPKRNSFHNVSQTLLSTDEFCEKIRIAVLTRHNPNFCIIARCEALIAGLDIKEMLYRLERYYDSGADALVIHSKQRNANEVFKCLHKLKINIPIILIPTSYLNFDMSLLQNTQVRLLIYANQALRASVTAIKTLLNDLKRGIDTQYLEKGMCSMEEIFQLQETDKLHALETALLEK